MRMVFQALGVVIIVVVVLAFIGVQPLGDYKDTILDKLSVVSDFGSSSPFDVAFLKPVVFSSPPDKVNAYLTLSPNNRTQLGASYGVQIHDKYVEVRDYKTGTYISRVGFSDALQSITLQVTLLGSTASDLFALSDSGKDIVIARRDVESSRARLESANESEERVVYDYFTRGVAPDYNSVKRIAQTVKDARVALDNKVKLLAQLESKWRYPKEVVGISVRDITSYLTFVAPQSEAKE